MSKEKKKKLVCYFCGIKYDHKYDECSCGSAATPITVEDLAKLNGERSSRIIALEKELSDIVHQYENEPLNFLLVNALKKLNEEQILSLADSLYERTFPGSGIRDKLILHEKVIANLETILK